MASLRSCPSCGRRARKALTSNWFPVYTCTSCKKKSCEQCGGKRCPRCGNSGYSIYDKVYAQ